ncbi:MAG: hypothetical protein A2504_05360 [Bdellovibrionales bacterium RIFOXYD12_FULL_39_22]|nr:MAG: hypothetical protein A2385_06465 [Bdellovibrionales bacterium RIFOXYB1_FULL_39_21]OFZ41921.1 MAG: hypothetical protein A2485_08435 [Bdellovibrionales bacterium RIFOXYC12_FULL_39_17]OFZ50637.1 MAG: hypothetical protein A2404_05385 [Bdellovibrionales bacterium RIFOXYC1_FULL_39_130]OFZ77860.1 MAG: hypothetical protein A2560_00555 [Bdellovibrionales bacterium RIFOXYD1_FULL_39_84]OFZ93704.1 MAG: hypothetical protein A2504_05360 [Bdellovibrionales bacterium RIFOXYD12_FULL_39_22]HLE10159.1 hy
MTATILLIRRNIIWGIFLMLCLPCSMATAKTAAIEVFHSSYEQVNYFKLYYGTVPGGRTGTGLVFEGNSTSSPINIGKGQAMGAGNFLVEVSGLNIPAETYFFTLTAIDASGNESSFSNEMGTKTLSTPTGVKVSLVFNNSNKVKD